ncbi:MAG: cell wall hydrolase [Firmicutes bacterium]|nr:cell wall hydrolase [Bacillota bacterium]
MKAFVTILLIFVVFFSLTLAAEAAVQFGLDWKVTEEPSPSAAKLNWWLGYKWGLRTVYAWESEDLSLAFAYIPQESPFLNSYLALGVRDLLGLSQLPTEDKVELTLGLELKLSPLVEGLSAALEYRVIPRNLVGEPNQLSPFFGLSLHYAFSERPPLTNWDDDDLYLLAKLIQAEADGEPYAGQVAVGAVVINRVKSPQFPNTIRAVIYQPGQFSCLPKLATNRPTEINLRAARDAMRGKDPSRGALFYYNPRLASPEGARFFATAKLRRTVRIGNHIFFRPASN